MDVLVVGQVARDLALRVEEVPGAGATAAVRERIEVLGGKGANQAVALAQLGVAPGLLGVVGDDRHAAEVLERAIADGIDVGPVVRRRGCRTGLIVDVVDAGGRWRYLEDLPQSVLLSAADVEAAWADAGTVVVQLQQPLDAVCAALDLARRRAATTVLDGAPPSASARADLLARTDVLRADDTEAALWADAAIESAADAVEVARDLLARGPRLVVLSAGGEGNVVVWAGGQAVLPLHDTDVVDTTGGGDAFTAGVVAALGRGPEEAARWGTAAAALTVGHLGGGPGCRASGWRRRRSPRDVREPACRHPAVHLEAIFARPGSVTRRKRGRAAECTRLESESPARGRGFESLRFRWSGAWSGVLAAVGRGLDINR
jgi:ribokinase